MDSFLAITFYIEISFIGYESVRLENIVTKGQLIDIGTIALSQLPEMLSEVEVSGERSTMEFKLDKRVLPSFSDLIGIKIEVLLFWYPKFMQTEP